MVASHVLKGIVLLGPELLGFLVSLSIISWVKETAKVFAKIVKKKVIEKLADLASV